MSAQPKAPKAPKAQTANGGSLKRLQPAVDLAERSSSAGQQVYEAVKAKLPTAAVERVEKLESAAAGAAAPLIHKAQDTGESPGPSGGGAVREGGAAACAGTGHRPPWSRLA